MKLNYKYELASSATPTQILEKLLEARGISDVKSFLTPVSPLSYTLSDFGFSKKDIAPMMKILKDIKAHGETVVVYTDYDADGITGGAILWETLYLLGFSVMPYVPHRKNEGYGFSKKGIDTIWQKYHPALIISCDHGITAKKEVAYAKSLGMQVIVTDHHHRQEEKVPLEVAGIFHIPVLSGSGTAYMVAKEIATYFLKEEAKPKDKIVSAQHKKLRANFEHDYQVLASIGTIADLVPLVKASRSIVYHGLAAFAKTKRPGLVELMKEARIVGKKIRTYEVGFIIAPRINAVGRLTHAIDALRLLCTTDASRAHILAEKIGGMNVDRQELVKVQVAEAKKKVEGLKKLPKLIILHAPHWHEGVIGLIASALVSEYYRPTIVMTKSDGLYKASVRSIPGFHVTNFLRDIGKFFENFGGHAAAAGFSLEEKNRVAFEKTAQKEASKLIHDDMLERVIEVDMKIPLSQATLTLANALGELEPYGVGNPKPLFVSQVEVVHASTMGKDKKHLKLRAKSAGKKGTLVDMVAFDMGEMISSIETHQTVIVVYSIDVNEWNGKKTVQGIVKHLELS